MKAKKVKEYAAIDLPYDDESNFISLYNKEFNIFIDVMKRQQHESRNDFISRINEEINRRFDAFERKVNNYNLFVTLSLEEKQREALSEWIRWHTVDDFKLLNDVQVKEIIDRYISWKLEKPVL